MNPYETFINKKHLVKPVIFSSDMGVSENSVPLNPMVNDHYPY